MSYIERLAYDREAREELQRLLDGLADSVAGVDAEEAVTALMQWRKRMLAEQRVEPRTLVSL